MGTIKAFVSRVVTINKMTNVGYIRHTSFLAILTDAKYIKTTNVQMEKNNFT